MSKAFNSKISLEFQLPTTSKDPKLRSANEFLLSALRALSSVSAKLSGFINENLRMYCWWRTSSRHIWRFVCALNNIHCSPPEALASHRMWTSAAAVHVRGKAVSYFETISMPFPPPSVDYQTALQNDMTCSTDNRDDLIQQVLARCTWFSPQTVHHVTCWLAQLEEKSRLLNNLEQEKEHWLLESRLLTMKLEKQVSYDVRGVGVARGG